MAPAQRLARSIDNRPAVKLFRKRPMPKNAPGQNTQTNALDVNSPEWQAQHAATVQADDNRQLAARKGPIIPLISCVSPRTLLRQTQLEKSISIDTTASGGNASLMTMPV